ncbi:MAG: hypothetical protein ABI402_18090 [Ferruginibacter sp.]
MLFFLLGCHSNQDAVDLDQFEQQLNKDAEKRLDAAYSSITKHCDSLLTYELPLKVDSILKTDTLK